jgi:hypothetical protein
VRVVAEASTVPFLRGAFLGMLAEFRVVPPEDTAQAVAADAQAPSLREASLGRSRLALFERLLDRRLQPAPLLEVHAVGDDHPLGVHGSDSMMRSITSASPGTWKPNCSESLTDTDASITSSSPWPLV